MTDSATLPEHSEHGASSCKRWWNCPGSVQLSRGIPNVESVYAAEGTAAHSLAEMCLTNEQDAVEYIGRTVRTFNVDEAMAEAVQVYVDHCRSLKRDTGSALVEHIEHRFNLSSLAPPAPMYGTADFVGVFGPWLWVCDLKYGQGVQVQAEGNPQLRYYALGAYLALPSEQQRAVRYIRGTIIQPRAPGGPAIRSADFDPIDLVEWSVELMDRAAATLQPGAPLQPGEWCKFCPAAGRCPGQAAGALAAAQIEFADPAPTLPPPALMTSVELSRALGLADQLATWLDDLKSAASAEISRGGTVPGWKLVPTDGRAAWRDPVEAEAALDLFHDLGDARFKPREIVSPAQARGALRDRMLPAHPTKKAAEAAARAALADLIHTPSSGVKLAPDADPRPALPTAGSEFHPVALENPC